MGSAAYGYDTGFFGGTLALPSFISEFGFDKMSKGEVTNEKANLVSLFQAGSFFGTIMQLPFTERYGRWPAIQFANIIFIASAFAQTFAHGSIPIFMFGRFLGGYAVGFWSLVIPVYLAEFAPASIRGRMVGFFDIFLQIGTLGGFWINYGIESSLKSNRFQWQFPVFVQFFPAVILGIGLFLCPETPRWLITKGRDEKALKNLCRLRRLPPSDRYIEYEFSQTKLEVEAEKRLRGETTLLKMLKELFRTKGLRNRVFLGMTLIGIKTFSGVQAVNYYSPIIFEQLGFQGSKNSLFATGIYGTCKFVGTLIFGLFIVDRVGRRKPLMIGAVVLSLCLFYIGGYLTAVGPREEGAPRKAGDYTAITAIFLYATAYCFGWNSVPLTIVSEIFTTRVRTLSMTFCIAFQWLCTFAIVRIMPEALSHITTRTYFVFASIFIWGLPFVYFFVPETKGLPLEYMDKLFGDGRTARERELVTEEGRIGSMEEKRDLEQIEDNKSLPTIQE
ncbi:general substrate transporter [Atractiella rhizophila]|nr:general substrate transporter [Atractiella rhizophila]